MMFLGMSGLLNENFGGLCAFGTVKVGLKYSYEKANIDFYPILCRYRGIGDGPDCGRGFSRWHNLEF